MEKTKAAVLQEQDNNFTLSYTDEWIKNHGYQFSPHLPLNGESSGASVKNFFNNLLPEGRMLEGFSQAYQVSQYDVFGILRRAGRDCAGALVLIGEDESPEETEYADLANGYHKIHVNELNDRLIESQENDTPVMLWKVTPRMSLAGVQNKLGVYLDKRLEVYLPTSGAPTSHILKPDLGKKHEGIAANEYFCMQLAQKMKLDVPNTIYKELPTPVILIKRYDRIWTNDGGLIRAHQIDGCQALNLPPSLKYEREFPDAPVGATTSNLLGITSLCKIPVVAKLKVLEWILFNYIIGNSDAHAKNISFLINEIQLGREGKIINEGMQVAPFYDLVCGKVYGYNEMAQSIGEEFEFEIVGGIEWRNFARDCDLDYLSLKKVATNLLKRLDAVLENTAKAVLEETKQPVVTAIVDVINQHKAYISESLL